MSTTTYIYDGRISNFIPVFCECSFLDWYSVAVSLSCLDQDPFLFMKAVTCQRLKPGFDCHWITSAGMCCSSSILVTHLLYLR